MYAISSSAAQCVRIDCPSNCVYCIDSKSCVLCDQATFLNSNFVC